MCMQFREFILSFSDANYNTRIKAKENNHYTLTVIIDHATFYIPLYSTLAGKFFLVVETDFPSADLMLNRICLLEVSLDWLDKGFRKRMNPFSYSILHLTITSFLKAPCIQLMIEEMFGSFIGLPFVRHFWKWSQSL